MIATRGLLIDASNGILLLYRPNKAVVPLSAITDLSQECLESLAAECIKAKIVIRLFPT